MEAQAENQVRAWFPSLRPIRQTDRLVFTFFREYNRFLNRGTSSWCRVLDDKLLFSGFLAGIGIRTPTTHWVVSKGSAASTTGERISIEELVQRLHSGRWFVKPRANEGGKGAFLLQDGAVTTADGQTDAKDAASVLKLLKADEDLLVQDALVQTAEYASFAPSSLNTVRCLTYLTRAGSAEVVAAIMRMGNGRSVVDNTASGGIYCAIGHETRCLVGPGYDKSGAAFEKHPTTGMVLQGTPIAQLDEVFAACTRAHEILGGPVTIGWDVSMTEQGPCIIEANTMWAASGPRADASARRRLWTCFLQDRDRSLRRGLSGQPAPDGQARFRHRAFPRQRPGPARRLPALDHAPRARQGPGPHGHELEQRGCGRDAQRSPAHRRIRGHAGAARPRRRRDCRTGGPESAPAGDAGRDGPGRHGVGCVPPDPPQYRPIRQ